MLLLSTFMAIVLPCYASTGKVDEYTVLNQGTEEDVKRNEENLKKKKEQLLEISNSAMQRALPSYKMLNVPCYQQEKSYWCGPANIKQVLQFLNGSSLSQSTYASDMGTASGVGTYVYKMVNELNAKQSKSTYCYDKIEGSEWSVDVLKSDIMNLTNVNLPSILHANTKYLAMYNGKSLGHYVTVSGYSLPNTIFYVDTYYNDYGNGSVLGTHQDTFQNAYNSISGRYIIY